MVGYTRQDTANNIANGNVIDADDLDSEFNAVEDAFNTTSGHSHDGTAGNGAAISKVGPGQDLIVGTTTVLPKSNNIMDLGSQAAQFKDAWFDGTVSTDALIVGNNSYTNISNNEYDVITGGLTFDVAGDITLDADGGDVILKDGGVTYGSLKGVSNELSIFSGTTEAVTLTGADAVIQGDLDVTTNATVGGTMSVTGDMTIPTANLTLNSGNAVIGGTLSVTGLITGNISTLSNHTTSGLTEGTNLYYTTARATTDAKAAISVTDAGGDGSVTYSAGTITYTGPSAAETRAHFSAGTGVAYSGGQFSIGQAVGTSSNVTFNNATVNGNLTVNGTTTTVNSNDVNIGDATLTLNSDETGTPSQDAGITIERGTATNKSLHWDESEDEWSVFGERFKAGTFEGNLTGNVTGNASTATALQTSRTIALTGDVTGSVAFNGTANATITATVQDDSHDHTIANVTGLQTALDAKADDSTTISAGEGLTGGGSLGANRTISHSDTSSQDSVSNSGNTVIQDITLDTYGHITGINSKTISTYSQPTSAGAVGTYAFLGRNSNSGSIVAGSSYSGSSLRYASLVSVNGYNYNTALTPSGSTTSGTWRAMGTATKSEPTKGTVFLRIS